MIQSPVVEAIPVGVRSELRRRPEARASLRGTAFDDRLSFFEEGMNGNAVLLVHGMSGAPGEMRLIARQFRRCGYAVFAPLLAGHGSSPDALRRSRWTDWLETVERSADWLGQRMDGVFAAGICVGGKLSLLAAESAGSPIRAAAIYSPCFQYDGWNVPQHYTWLSPHIRWLSHIPFIDRLNFSETPSLGIKDDRMRRLIAAMETDGVLSHFPGRGVIEMDRLGRYLKKRLPHIKTPTLVVHSTQDDLSGPNHARYIVEHLGGPNMLHWLNDSYHMIHVDRQHREVAALSTQFFETHHADAT